MTRRTRSRAAAAALAAAVLAVVGAGPALAQAAGAAGVTGPLGPVLPVPYERALQAGTRSRTGAPGPSYWQNGADYDIRARISPRDSLLSGDERVVYHNRSPDTLTTVVFHLYQNLMSPWSRRERPTTPGIATRGMVVERLVARGHPIDVPREMTGREVGPDSASVYSTLMTVPLPEPLLPGDSAVFDVSWHFTIPPSHVQAPGCWGGCRMGMQDPTTAQIAQWYPQIAVYDDVHGWDTEQYTGTGEFYLDYGHFRYSVTIPA
ncbi:MAG TPA: hypothetical protein VKA44_03595, partial [Gemmatimonadota bacterium]|nr:hypothetical protein [Gemmatimonadota bacterium]